MLTPCLWSPLTFMKGTRRTVRFYLNLPDILLQGPVMPRDYGAIVTLIIDCQRRDKETPQNHLALSHFITFYYKFSKVAKLLDLSKLIDPISGLSTGADMTGESLF